MDLWWDWLLDWLEMLLRARNPTLEQRYSGSEAWRRRTYVRSITIAHKKQQKWRPRHFRSSIPLVYACIRWLIGWMWLWRDREVIFGWGWMRWRWLYAAVYWRMVLIDKSDVISECFEPCDVRKVIILKKG